MARNRRVMIGPYGYREQNDFDPSSNISPKDKGQSEAIAALQAKVQELDEKKAEKEEVEVIKNTVSSITNTINEVSGKTEEISNLVEELSGKSFQSVEYNEETKNIIFKNGNGDSVGELSASDFIKDGMIESVEYDDVNKKLIIRFNTESGKEEIEVDLSDLFVLNAGNGIEINPSEEKGLTVSVKLDDSEDSDPFLTVTPDGIKLSGVSDAIDAEAQRAKDAEAELDAKITAMTSNDVWHKVNDKIIDASGHPMSDYDRFAYAGDDENNPLMQISTDGILFLNVEGEIMNVNDLLGQLAHETYYDGPVDPF